MGYQLDGKGWNVVFSPVCMWCRHFDPLAEKNRTCEAYPEEIPLEIWIGENDHKKPYKGDNGIMFEPRTEEEHKALVKRLEAAAQEVLNNEEVRKAAATQGMTERIYVTAKHKAPKGRPLQRGPRGGVFYFGTKKEKAEAEKKTKAGPGGEGQATKKPLPVKHPKALHPSDIPEDTPCIDLDPEEKLSPELIKRLSHEYARRKAGDGFEVNPSSKEEMEYILNYSKYALISAGRNPNRPGHQDLDENEFRKRHEGLRKDLAEMGYVYTQTLGKYGEREDSFLVMVHQPDDPDIVKLGRKYEQDSVILSEKGAHRMIYTTDSEEHHAGDCIKGEGWMSIEGEASDYYTEVVLAAGKAKTRFSLDFDWDTPYFDCIRS